MAIKVIVNYPEDPEVLREIEANQARIALNYLHRKLGKEKLEELIKLLAEQNNNAETKE